MYFDDKCQLTTRAPEKKIQAMRSTSIGDMCISTYNFLYKIFLVWGSIKSNLDKSRTLIEISRY